MKGDVAVAILRSNCMHLHSNSYCCTYTYYSGRTLLYFCLDYCDKS